MDELDNDFKELCANLLSRVKKKAGDAEGGRKVQSRTRSTATKSKLKKSKSTAKSKSQHDSSAGKRMGWPGCTDPNEQALGHEPEGEAAACGNDGPPLGDENGDPPAIQLDAMVPNCSQNTLAGSDKRRSPFAAAAAEPATSTSSPAKTLQISGTRLRVAELVLERMQQFKRVEPKQLKHTRGSSLLETVTDGNILDVIQEKNQPGNVTTPDLPAKESDVALAVALQQELKEEVPGSLEEAGLFFCQICQKDLSAMNATRREQHVNRCLDEMEKSQVSSSSNPQIPECPICGKQFHTPKSRASHLKRCAVKMEVPPQLLLQAVQSQALALGDGLPVAPSSQLSRSKRKRSSKEKESKKKRKTSKVETKDEDLLVAMAMSRSLLEQIRQEQAKSVTTIKLESALPIKWKPGAEKKRRKNVPRTPPPLLLQDPETAHKRIQSRMAMLLTEEVEFPSTPPLPASRILEEEPGKAAWLLSLPKDQRCILWEYSTLTGPCVPESFYAVGLTPPILPWKPVQQLQTISNHPDPASVGLGNRTTDDPQADPDGEQQFLSCSQKDVQTLQDLVELAGEGLTLTQWNIDIDHTSEVKQLRGESVASDIPLSGFVPPSKVKMCQSSNLHTSSLRSLAADFSGMVNNPHLSDVQFQVDSGEVLYAHMFVLYARCPQLTEVVHSEGFLVEEDGNLRTRRVLLSEVTVEAARAFLQYLYAADISIPAQVLSDVGALAVRFDVSELISVCGNSPGETEEHAVVDSGDELFSVGEEENCDNRAENFQELLRSMWVDEDEEEVALLKPEDQEEEDNEKVDEQELEEIYEFVATQRKIVQDEAEVEEGTGSCTYSETEEAQNVNQQTEDEEVEVCESPSTSSKIKEWKENFRVGRSSCESPGQEKKIPGISRSESMSVTQIAPVHLQDKPCECGDVAASHGRASDEREGSQRMPKVVKVSRFSQISQGEEENDAWEKMFPSCRHNGADLSKSYDPMFSATQGEHCEPSPLNEDNKESGEIFSETHVEVNKPPIHHQSQKDLLSVRSDLCSSPLINPCSPVLPAVGSSPMSPESNRTFSRVSTEISPISAPKQNKNKGLFQSDDASFQKASEQNDASGFEKIIKNTLSPAKFPHVDLKKQKHVPTGSSLVHTTQNSASHVNQEAEVILLLDSDEEMELEQMKKKSDSESSLREMEISRRLDCNCKKVQQEHNVPKSGPVSVADIEIHQRQFQVSLGSQDKMHSENAVKLSGEMPLNNQVGTCIDSRLILSHEESSSMDTSWLVPDTPLLTRSRNCSTQTQATSICCLRSQGYKHRTTALLVNTSDHKQAGETMKIPEITSDLLLATSSQKHLLTENSPVSKKTSPGSPLGQSWKDSLRVSPAPVSPACVRVKEKSSENPSSPIRGLPCRELSLENKTDISVVEVEDSEEEKEVAPLPSSGSFLLGDEPPIPVDDDCWSVEHLSPVKDNNRVPERLDCANTSSPTRGKSGSQHNQWKSPIRALEITGSTPLRGNPIDNRKTLFCHEESPIEAHSSVSNRLSFRNSKVWDDWDEDELPEILPLTQRVSAAAAAQNTQPLKTPDPVCHKRNQPPRVPITPVPAYSIMETPELKKELHRFGVRPLPKRQMVLKLKEIFQYTHQIMSSDSEDEIPSSQPPLQKATAKYPSQPQADLIELREESSKASSVGHKQKLGVSVPSLPVLGSGDADSSAGPSATGYLRTKKTAETKGHPGGARGIKGDTLSPATSPVKGSLVGSADGQVLSASQESAASSVAGSDNSFESQSSSFNEFETGALTSEEDEGIPASQAAAREADKLEAVRRYIHSNPVLHRKILLYQPFELTGLQAELKQNGIKIALGKLLDFLDAHCITFTTAGARKEKQQQCGGKKKGCKRY
ncbi:structure-specific endonuclease subunit SLX4 isoform X1 [Malaclemys terrapin pileata]|uniref:structure-specific endonuclease subunit SLX4 isoform X1 n=1 Tax=Malaclemys terrapin pileata TaxID=2991368 RepID=UPI0023A7ECCB|nr:structure-specific endonuclease subunit SLX4 isoform X1 [Malaclemys terrapin pileata]XP_053898454.1 structure-specific endonuclease subunit SLX4 isoform X1 [Malaclemys terrapin pileata]XP_053898455.1 structure-specific endonuclease subunit SLX4 isoform X1 [Malaclemys terrapin pileata]XP_053898456.1 structure-specific endonuclease subunit SLX4 isoform X1 [Malaclemys terrapin pileata]XP_053898457.1 structure-specific endonuclease subunit SLX4 isoform X1 [Malaclemys terrapin pileata]